MSAANRELHLGVNVLSDGMHPAAWQHPSADPNWFTDPAYWIDVARTAERGTLDALFLADSPSLFQKPDEPLVAPPLALDPLVLLSTLASATSHLGLIGTVSTSFEEPYNVARRFSSLDHLSRGRVAWNVVTSSDPYAWNNFGHGDGPAAHPDRGARYRRAAEFIAVVRALWDSWDDDAVLADKRAGAFSRPGAIRTIDHRGEFFSVDGPLTLPCPRRGIRCCSRQADRRVGWTWRPGMPTACSPLRHRCPMPCITPPISGRGLRHTGGRGTRSESCRGCRSCWAARKRRHGDATRS